MNSSCILQAEHGRGRLVLRAPGARRRLAIIYNPAAGQRRQRRYVALVTALREAGCEIRALPTLAPGDAERIAAVVSPAEAEVLVVAGGDGTINEAVNGLLGNEAGGGHSRWRCCHSAPPTCWLPRSDWRTILWLSCTTCCTAAVGRSPWGASTAATS